MLKETYLELIADYERKEEYITLYNAFSILIYSDSNQVGKQRDSENKEERFLNFTNYIEANEVSTVVNKMYERYKGKKKRRRSTFSSFFRIS